MTLNYDFDSERIVKSADRVRSLAEVFTPNSTVQEMLNLFPAKVWNPHPSYKFLEPACGDGNFVSAILDRKLERISEFSESLDGHEDFEFLTSLALEALASIYAVDISRENIVGGTAGHEIGARRRLTDKLHDWFEFESGRDLSDNDEVIQAAQWIVEHNIMIGNMLAIDAGGNSTNRNEIPIIEYSFQPREGLVTLRKTTLGEIAFSEQQANTDLPMLFEPEPPTPIWTGKILKIAEVDRIRTPKMRGPAHNGISR